MGIGFGFGLGKEACRVAPAAWLAAALLCQPIHALASGPTPSLERASVAAASAASAVGDAALLIIPASDGAAAASISEKAAGWLLARGASPSEAGAVSRDAAVRVSENNDMPFAASYATSAGRVCLVWAPPQSGLAGPRLALDETPLNVEAMERFMFDHEAYHCIDGLPPFLPAASSPAESEGRADAWAALEAGARGESAFAARVGRVRAAMAKADPVRADSASWMGRAIRSSENGASRAESVTGLPGMR